MAFSSLPFELKETIFSLTDTHGLLQLALCNSTCKEVAESFLYRRVRLACVKADIRASLGAVRFCKCLQTLIYTPRHKLVYEFIIEGVSKMHILLGGYRLLMRALTLMSNLRVLVVADNTAISYGVLRHTTARLHRVAIRTLDCPSLTPWLERQPELREIIYISSDTDNPFSSMMWDAFLIGHPVQGGMSSYDGCDSCSHLVPLLNSVFGRDYMVKGLVPFRPIRRVGLDYSSDLNIDRSKYLDVMRALEHSSVGVETLDIQFRSVGGLINNTLTRSSAFLHIRDYCLPSVKLLNLSIRASMSDALNVLLQISPVLACFPNLATVQHSAVNLFYFLGSQDLLATANIWKEHNPSLTRVSFRDLNVSRVGRELTRMGIVTFRFNEEGQLLPVELHDGGVDAAVTSPFEVSYLNSPGFDLDAEHFRLAVSGIEKY